MVDYCVIHAGNDHSARADRPDRCTAAAADLDRPTRRDRTVGQLDQVGGEGGPAPPDAVPRCPLPQPSPARPTPDDQGRGAGLRPSLVAKPLVGGRSAGDRRATVAAGARDPADGQRKASAVARDPPLGRPALRHRRPGRDPLHERGANHLRSCRPHRSPGAGADPDRRRLAADPQPGAPRRARPRIFRMPGGSRPCAHCSAGIRFRFATRPRC